MAVQPGEENVATLFADIHYFYGPESDQPRHHRFDKGSYVYLFENANERRARIEVANHPGTDEQDAFEGFLDKTKIQYSYKHSCMVSLTVGETTNQNEWHLPTYDPRNENKYHYKLHSLDIYFWTQTDALQFVNGIRSMLPPSQFEVLDEPGPPPTHAPAPSAMSPVVQQLEKAAISDPVYGTPKPASQNAPTFSPPPISAVSQAEAPATFVPMAYNPAAPAAPEAVRHREKTPPPDDDGLNPLAVAVAYDYQQQPFSPGFAPPPPGPPGAPGITSPGFPPAQFGGPPYAGPPGAPAVTSPGFPPAQFGAPPHPGIQRAATMPAHAGMPSPGLTSPYGAGYPASPGFAPPHHGQSQGHPTPPVTSPGLPPPPPGGYSQYNYNNPQGPSGPQQNYSIHQQMYRPTEGETSARYTPKQKLESNSGRLERGVGGMLKKFEKKFG